LGFPVTLRKLKSGYSQRAVCVFRIHFDALIAQTAQHIFKNSNYVQMWSKKTMTSRHLILIWCHVKALL